MSDTEEQQDSESSFEDELTIMGLKFTWRPT